MCTEATASHNVIFKQCEHAQTQRKMPDFTKSGHVYCNCAHDAVQTKLDKEMNKHDFYILLYQQVKMKHGY
jgi:hypothetical protein